MHKQGIRTDDEEVADRWAREAPITAVASGHIKTPCVVHFEPAHGDEHGDEIIRSVHRLRADIARNADGSLEVRALYHYPERDAADDSAMAEQHPLVTKRQWAKVPQLASKRHWIVPQKDKTP